MTLFRARGFHGVAPVNGGFDEEASFVDADVSRRPLAGYLTRLGERACESILPRSRREESPARHASGGLRTAALFRRRLRFWRNAERWGGCLALLPCPLAGPRL